MYNPKISVAMASYNCHMFIEESLKSIISQTYSNWECIIVIDGGDVNRTIEVIKKVAREHYVLKKIKVFVHNLNYGYGAALRNAIEKGTGEIVAIVDADDALASPKAFEIMVSKHREHPEASLIYSDYYECNREMKNAYPKRCNEIPPNHSFLGKFRGDQYIGTNYNISHLKTFKKEAYNKTEGLDHTLLKAVDKDIVLKLEEVGSLVHVPKHLYYHRNHRDSISNMYRTRSPEYKAMIKESKNRMYLNAKKRREQKNEHIH